MGDRQEALVLPFVFFSTEPRLFFDLTPSSDPLQQGKMVVTTPPFTMRFGSTPKPLMAGFEYDFAESCLTNNNGHGQWHMPTTDAELFVSLDHSFQMVKRELLQPDSLCFFLDPNESDGLRGFGLLRRFLGISFRAKCNLAKFDSVPRRLGAARRAHTRLDNSILAQLARPSGALGLNYGIESFEVFLVTNWQPSSIIHFRVTEKIGHAHLSTSELSPNA